MTNTQSYLGYASGTYTDGVFTETSVTRSETSSLTYSGDSMAVGSTVTWNYGTSGTYQVTYEGYYLLDGTPYLLILYNSTYELLGITAAGNYPITAATYSCFLEGTMIDTADGAVCVEQLRIGDRVVLARGGTATVRWLGYTRRDAARDRHPMDLYPVRVIRDAFGTDMPRRDLFLSPDHAVHVDGVLIPIRHLINDATVIQQPAGTITYWHVELDRHDVILAEGLPAESYLDTGNRAAFDNAPVPQLHARLAPEANSDAASCAERVTAGPVVEAVRDHLARRAVELGHRLPNLVEAIVAGGGSNTVTLPPGTTHIALISRAGMATGDRRRLGVAVTSLKLDGVPIDLRHGTLGAGFHPVEGEGAGAWRWTDGRGIIVVAPSPLERHLTVTARPGPATLSEAA